jgi:hypothetical protein
VSERDRLQTALVTAVRRLEAVLEDASPLAAAAALEAASGAARLLSGAVALDVLPSAREELLELMRRAALLMRSLSQR